MAQNEQKISEDFRKYAVQCGGGFADWYIGICENPDFRLFNNHGVDRTNDSWIYAFAVNTEAAKKIAAEFMKTCRATGAEQEQIKGRGVYAYRRNQHTKP